MTKIECDRDDCSFMSESSAARCTVDRQLTGRGGTTTSTSSLHHFINLLLRSHINVRQAFHIDTSGFIFVNGKIIVVSYTSAYRHQGRPTELTSKQILDLLHVYFHIADFDCIFDITIGHDYRCKDLLDDSWDQTFEGLVRDIGSLTISLGFTQASSADHHS